MSKQPKEISIDWPPKKPERVITYIARGDNELDYSIPLISNEKKRIKENTI